MLQEPELSVLLIEDEPDAARLVQHVLAQAGEMSVALEWVGDLRAGLDRLAQRQYQAVLLDLNLPDSDGFDTFSKVRQQAPDAAVIVLTAQEDEALAVQSVRAGADDYLMKSDIRNRMLPRRIRYAIERSRLKRAHADNPARNGRIFTFVGAKGGAGTTTLLLNLAAELAKAGKSVTAIELMQEFGSFAGLLGYSPSWDIATLLAGAPGTMSRDALACCLEDSGCGFRVLSGPRRVKEYRPATPEQVRALLGFARTLAEYTLIDLPPASAPPVQEVVRHSTLTALVVECSRMGLRSALARMPALQAMAARPGAVCAVLVSKTPFTEFLTPAEFDKRLGCPVFAVVPPAGELHAGADSEALTVLGRPDTLFSRSIQNFARRLGVEPVSGVAA